MDFVLDPTVENYRRRYREFVRDRLLPLDTDPASFDEHENIRLDLLETLRAEAKAAGLWAPQMPRERGGQGLDVVAIAACYEEMNYSLFGPVVFNCAAPDDGNMTVLNKIGTERQKARWLQPIAEHNPVSFIFDGIRSLFYGGWDLGALAGAFGVAAAISAVFLPLAVRALNARVVRT